MFISIYFGTCLTLAICVIGDKYGSLPILQDPRLAMIRAIIDNFTHGFVGCISWWLVVGYKQPSLSLFNSTRIKQSLFCLSISSFIDVDHILAAGSLHIRDIVNLPYRPPLHCTGLCILINICFFGLTKFYPGMELLPWEWLISFASHHVRDATRRGFWLIPGLLTTRPLPYYLYLAAIATLPFLVGTLAPIQSATIIANRTIITI